MDISRQIANVPLALRRNRGEVVAVILIVAAAAVYPFMPIALWMLPLLLILGYLGRRVAALSRRDALWVLACVAGSLGIQLLTIAIWGVRDPATANPRVDDYHYLTAPAVIAEAWKSGWFPRLSMKGSLPYLSTLHTGYERVLALLYIVFGPKFWVGFALNVFCAATMPLAVFLLTRSLFGADCNATRDAGFEQWLRSPDANPANLHVARCAALLTALHPVFPYWVRWLYRDLVLGLVFTVALTLAIDFLRRPRVLIALLFGFALIYVTMTRAYVGLGLVLGLLMYSLALLPRRIAFWGAVYLLLALLIFSFTRTGSTYMGQLIHAITNLMPLKAASLEGSLAYFAAGVPRLLFAPYGWVRATVAAPEYGMYPGMWMLYLVVYPGCVLGLLWAARTNHLMTIPPMIVVASTAILVLIAYEGDMTRRRMWLEPLLIVYASAGIAQRRRGRYFAGWYLLLGLAAAAQLIALRVRQ